MGEDAADVELEATPESMRVRFVTVDPRWRASSPVTAVTFDRATGSEAVAVTT